MLLKPSLTPEHVPHASQNLMDKDADASGEKGLEERDFRGL
jgi:hypothetical protein